MVSRNGSGNSRNGRYDVRTYDHWFLTSRIDREAVMKAIGRTRGKVQFVHEHKYEEEECNEGCRAIEIEGR